MRLAGDILVWNLLVKRISVFKLMTSEESNLLEESING